MHSFKGYTTTKYTYNHDCERSIITVEQPLLGRVWLYVGYLQQRFNVHRRKLESALPITTVVLNNRCEKFKNSELDTHQHHFCCLNNLSLRFYLSTKVICSFVFIITHVKCLFHQLLTKHITFQCDIEINNLTN